MQKHFLHNFAWIFFLLFLAFDYYIAARSLSVSANDTGAADYNAQFRISKAVSHLITSKNIFGEGVGKEFDKSVQEQICLLRF